MATLQFFGDTYISRHALNETGTTLQNLRIFEPIKPLLYQSEINIANLEGAITTTKFPLLIDKAFHLRMPPVVADILLKANIRAVSIGNNHTMDFGYMGLFETMTLLRAQNIAYTGAGVQASEAAQPAIVATAFGNICFLSFSQVYPSEAWSRAKRPGSLHISFSRVSALIRNCAQKHAFTIPLFHWGEEGSHEPKEYQIKLARLAIDSGASLVVGHHPHVIQSIETYKSKLILYSLGNFAFATRPMHGKPEGLSAKIFLAGDKRVTHAELTPLDVDNRRTHFRPRLFKNNAPLANLTDLIKDRKVCFPLNKANAWKCDFSGGWKSSAMKTTPAPHQEKKSQ